MAPRRNSKRGRDKSSNPAKNSSRSSSPSNSQDEVEDISTPAPPKRIRMNINHCTLMWFDETSDYGIHKNMSMIYTPKPLDEETAILLHDDFQAIGNDVVRLFPENHLSCSKLFTSCLICDENTTLGESASQVNLIDMEFVPGLLYSEHFSDTRMFVLHHELLLHQDYSQQKAMISKIVNEAFESAWENKHRVVIYIPRLERLWGNLEPDVKLLLEEKLFQGAKIPILVLSTTCWTPDELPADLYRLFKGPASSQHTISFPSAERIQILLQRVLPNHPIFNLTEGNEGNQCEKVLAILNDSRPYLEELCRRAVRVSTGKLAGVIMTLYYTLQLYCDLQRAGENKEHMDTSMYFLFERLSTAIGAVI